VTAKDKATNKQQSITITGASTLPKDEVERMVKDAEENATVDKEKIEQIEVKNQAETICYQAKKQIETIEVKEEKQKLEDIVSKLEAALQKEDYSAMKEIIAEYSQVASSQNPSAENPVNDDVIETDFSAEK
jgi:molecular chaperone DnaK